MAGDAAGWVSSVVQVQLIVLCSRYSGYQTSSPGCDITFSNITFTGASPSSPSSSPSSSSSASSSSSPSSSPVNFDGDGESLDPQASTALGVASPDPQAASPSPQATSPSGGGAGQGASFSGVVAFDRPVVGAQSLQSLAGMMYSGGLSNGRCAVATTALLTITLVTAALVTIAGHRWLRAVGWLRKANTANSCLVKRTMVGPVAGVDTQTCIFLFRWTIDVREVNEHS